MGNASVFYFGYETLVNNRGLPALQKEQSKQSNLLCPANVTEPGQEVHREEAMGPAVIWVIIRTNEIQPVWFCSLLRLM